MDAQQFRNAVAKLKAIPADARKSFAMTADALSPEDRLLVVERLQGVDADLRRNARSADASVRRHALMVDQVEKQDIPALRSLADAA